MAQKADYIGSYTDKYDKRYTTLFYRYRGHEYQIVKANNWMSCSSDYTMRGGSMSLARQHKEAQDSIDAKIEAEKNPQPIPEAKWTKEYEDEIWKMMFGEEV